MPGRAGMLCPSSIPEYMGLRDCPWLFILGWSKGLVALAGTRPAQRTDKQCCMGGCGSGSCARGIRTLINAIRYIDCYNTMLHAPHFVTRRAHVMTCQARPDTRTWQSTFLLQPTSSLVGFRKEMPTLTPSYLPPSAISAFSSPPCASSNGTRFNATTPTSPKQDAVTQRSEIPSVRNRALKVPFVKLDTPTIQEDMAASLAVALLGHVLFLKSQVPLYATSLLMSLSLLNN
jgi:hypothetical protein